MDLSMVVPIYNEESNLLELANRIESAMNQAEITQWEVIFVNDGSTDRSQSVLLQLQQRDSRYRVVQFQINQGQTAAMDAGFRYARNPYVLTMDADLQNDPHDFVKLQPHMAEGVGCVCGVRLNRKDTLLKRISSRIANAIRNWLSDEQITDTGCSLKLFRKECLDRLKLYEGLHRFLPTLCKMEGFTVIEVPVSHHARLFGTSSYGVWNRVFKSFFDLLAVRWMKRRQLKYQKIAQEVQRLKSA
ncbi:MAG: glycosyltransferase family 2 protein [Acidobacteria bacterium]|nr:glycosyltransferase family 2 protein [Acidobacteriota bacterium]